jgi:mannosyl-oligosaccharide alpha-1,2-mannosidase
VLESNFHAWRVTGDTKYLDRAAGAIASFNKYLPATVAFAGLNDVNSANGGLIDDMESFWFAEVLKYLYVYVYLFCASSLFYAHRASQLPHI